MASDNLCELIAAERVWEGAGKDFASRAWCLKEELGREQYI